MLKHPDDMPVMLNAAKHRSRPPARPFASLRVTTFLMLYCAHSLLALLIRDARAQI